MADGSPPALPLVAPLAVQEVLQELELQEPGRRIPHRGRARAVWPILLVGLLREECSLRIADVGRRTERPGATVSEGVEAHRELLQGNPEYGELASRTLSEILIRLHGPATARLRRLHRGLPWNE